MQAAALTKAGNGAMTLAAQQHLHRPDHRERGHAQYHGDVCKHTTAPSWAARLAMPCWTSPPAALSHKLLLLLGNVSNAMAAVYQTGGTCHATRATAVMTTIASAMLRALMAIITPAGGRLYRRWHRAWVAKTTTAPASAAGRQWHHGHQWRPPSTDTGWFVMSRQIGDTPKPASSMFTAAR